MAKRFIDTGIFDDEWFMELSKEGKILWIYFITKCDHAGLIHLNLKLASVQTGIKDLSATIKELGNRLVTVKEQLYFIPKYISFQYPGFPNSNVRQQASAIELLLKYDLLDKTSLTVKEELANDYVYVNDNVHDIVKPEKTKKNIPEFDEFKNYALETDPLIDVHSLEIKYKAWKENGWKNGKEKEIKNWKSALLNTLPYIKHNTSPLPQPQQTYPKRGLVENPNFDPR